MTTKRLSLKQFVVEVKELTPRTQEGIVRGLRSAALRMPEIVREELHATQPHAAVATGELARSTKVDRVEDGAIVGMDAPHAAIIEEGARPHFPPIQPLKDWVRVKGLADSPEDEEGIAFAVARAISKRGIAPRKYFKRSFDRMLPIVAVEVDAEMKGVLK